MEPGISEAARLLRGARSALFITGAGMSAESGLPTYRGIGGLYDDGGTDDGVSIEEALSGTMLRRDPALCWRHIGQLERSCRGATFNDGHAVLARLEQRLERCCVLTQNVDGFHRDAGSDNVIEMHGTLRRLRCTSCAWRGEVRDYRGMTLPPSCSQCGRLVRPEVVLFGEQLPRDALLAYDYELARGHDVVFTIGTTSVFPYIAWPVIQAAGEGRGTVEINPGESEVSGVVGVRIRAGAAASLRAIEGLLDDWGGQVERC